MQKCENCHKEFCPSKIHIHSSYCSRNFRKCSQCQELVDNNYIQEHLQEFHTTTPCVHCFKPFTTQQMAIHVESCIDRPITCDFCQHDIESGEYERHMVRCGARTQYCNTCGEYVQLSEQATHLDRCYPKIESKFKVERLDGKECSMRKPQPKPQLEGLWMQSDGMGDEDQELQRVINESLKY